MTAAKADVIRVAIVVADSQADYTSNAGLVSNFEALLKKAAGIASGSKVPNKEKVGKVTRKQVMEIVKIKAKDLNSASDEAGFRVVAGTARSMGIDVTE